MTLAYTLNLQCDYSVPHIVNLNHTLTTTGYLSLMRKYGGIKRNLSSFIHSTGAYKRAEIPLQGELCNVMQSRFCIKHCVNC